MFNNLPGVQIQTVDGGLATNRTPATKSIVILGTAAKGAADTPYQVTDSDLAVAEFGTQGTLVAALEEVGVYCDNIYLFRVGTTPAQLAGVGVDTGNASGMTIEFGERTDNAGDRYKVWYKDGVLYVWLDGTMVYSNDADLGNVLDVGNVQVTGAATNGLVLALASAGTGTIKTTGPTVNGTGTSFRNELTTGDFIQVNGDVHKVAVVTDDMHVTLETALPADLTVNTAFQIIKGVSCKTPDGALTLAQAAALTSAGSKKCPVLTKANTGLGLTLRQLYIAQQKAINLLDTFPVQGIFAPGCRLDAPNVAFYNQLDPKTNDHNPLTNPDALDWLCTTKDDYGYVTFHWASENKDSDGKAKTPVTFLNRDDRLNRGYREVNFGYQLARFAQNQEEEFGGCMAFIGTAGPKGFDLPNIREWIGFLPAADDTTNNLIKAGKGLLGIPYLVGCPSASLNPLCHDYPTGSRQPGFFQTDTGEYDGDTEFDRNTYPIDIGAYLHVVGDYALIASGAGRYVGNVAGLVAGMIQALDEKSACTNKPLRLCRQLYRASLTQLDALTGAKINMLRFKRVSDPPYVLHDRTAASDISDWLFVLRMRIKFLVVQQLFEQGDRFIGDSSADGLQLQAMQTALDAALQNLQKRGYIQRYRFTVSTTAGDQRIGRAFIDVAFMPADELVQLRATVAISRT